MSHHLFMTEVSIILETLLVQQGPVLALHSWHRHVPRLEVRPIEEEGLGVGVRPIFPVVGHKTVVVPAMLEAVIPSEGGPPNHDGKVWILERTSPTREDLSCHSLLHRYFKTHYLLYLPIKGLFDSLRGKIIAFIFFQTNQPLKRPLNGSYRRVRGKVLLP